MDHKKEPKKKAEFRDEDLVSREADLTEALADAGIDIQDPEDASAEIGEISEPEDQLEDRINLMEELQAKADEYLDGWQRSRAEFANYKKRILREQAEIHRSARGEVIKMYLDIADDLERALEGKPAEGDGAIWSAGIELIYQKLITRFESEGIKPMNALGQEFDPNIHEAIMKEKSDQYESGQIIEVLQKGYWIGDKVLRPAQVRVAA